MEYESFIEVESTLAEGVRFRIRRMSFGRRLELIERLHTLLKRLEFLQGQPNPSPTAEAEIAGAAAEIDREHLRWGLAAVSGLTIDGHEATPETLLEKGPEPLLEEALRAVRRESGLDEEERKNSESHSTSQSAAEPGGDAENAAA